MLRRGFRLIGVWLQGAEPPSRRALSRLGLVPVPLLKAFKKASGNRWRQVDVEETHPHQFLGPRTMCSDTFEGSLCN